MKRTYKVVKFEIKKEDLSKDFGKHYQELEEVVSKEFNEYYSNINLNKYSNSEDSPIGRTSWWEINFNPNKTKYTFELFRLNDKHEKEVLEEMILNIEFKE